MVDFCDVTVSPTHRKKRPRVPRAVPSFSEHRNSVLLRCAMQNEASILSFRKPPIRGSVTNCVVYFGDPSHRSVGLKWARRAGGSEAVATPWRHATPRRHRGPSPPSDNTCCVVIPPVASRGATRRRDVTTDGPHPRLKKKTHCGPWAIGKKKQTGCGGWVFVFGDRPGRAFAPLATSVTLSE